MQRQYEVYFTQHNSNRRHKVNAGRSIARVGVLFGSLIIAFGLILVPVYMKHDNGKLMDVQQYTAMDGNAVIAAGGPH